ncbi:MAG TPA: pyridoxal-dependent decarboxylase, exosortase A system-associated [Nitrosomonas sp.]|nr:pyridoxal-dependent decarboxylase, exosortase A system-associated [Nitrosomonas sp.]HMW21561.1 pyridoxal-dependent decarboxylase, exosortase A system-associated [Nitrosomonas sp.]HMW69237.1 pyridoxal-dependent decarboxylase, exosortase A system-associated [Nitrosomonas sp.]HMY61096.1 pyridoxal-dependent decarboxylase, exosortase A system-associated [Nitrosomonas sp.]HMY91027.1 pyridoxal-dependent decarboxylase, exosortase A system-associated [Nitrosomonas sp.]
MTNNRPKHASFDQFPIRDHCIQIGGMSLNRLTQRVGSTPYFAYDRKLITERILFLRQCLPNKIKLHYAMKANPMPAVVQHIAGLVDGIDVASLGEIKVALDTGMLPSKISFAGPGKNEHELSCAIAAGIVINIESELELERIVALAERLGITPKVAVRINPDFELKSSGMKMGGGPKQFGIDAERAPIVLRRIVEFGIVFEGLHIFSGSQNLKVEAIQDAHEKTLQLAVRLAKESSVSIPSLNMGGGFGIPYFPGESPLNLVAVGENLQHLLNKIESELLDTQFVIELGRYIVAEAGIYVCRVLDKKNSRGQLFLITDGGMHHHLAASGNFGQVIRKNYPVTVGTKAETAETEVVSVVGPLCTPLDLLADQMELPKAEIGDLIVVFQSGAYGLTASPISFLSHPIPLEVLV